MGSNFLVGKCPIDDVFLEKRIVGNQNMNIFSCSDPCAPSPYFLYHAENTVNFDDIADINGALPENHETGNEIVDQILGPESNPDGHGTA